MQVTTDMEYLADCDCLLICQRGELSPETIKSARQQSRPFYTQHAIHKALVDYRQADLTRLRLIELDTLAQEFRNDLPDCHTMAIVFTASADITSYQHIKNVCEIHRVTTEIFDDFDAARRWIARQA
ncbi:hypothetical protein [Motiliproteus sediminis]|uniref:hypothetical protein n=1 Tax=Motiliproteus sediminis TaxID=1468178 RepID=UPI001AEF5C16|nr:hypothetical protein [Motiliproteus sediminis]